MRRFINIDDAYCVRENLFSARFILKCVLVFLTRNSFFNPGMAIILDPKLRPHFYQKSNVLVNLIVYLDKNKAEIWMF